MQKSKFLTFSGASPIKSLLTTVPENCFGWLDNVDHVIEHGRSYLLLTRDATPVSTLILCHQEEEMLEELKVLQWNVFALHMSSEIRIFHGCWMHTEKNHFKGQLGHCLA